jgi:sugar O-acyltransferase (sialic acid O-acetyltransferase NeuD family)
MTGTGSIVLYAVGSPLVADVEETCRRLGVAIAGAVRNVDGAHCLLDASVLRELADVDAPLRRVSCIVPLFSPANRRRAVGEAIGRGFAIAPALVDPTAIVASSAQLGDGSYLNAGVVVGAAARLGRHVIVNRAGSIGHHAALGDFVSIGPGATVAGLAAIERGAMIGAGAVVLPQVAIGAGCVIGAGAVVTRNVPAGSMAVGNPATIIRDGLPLIDGGERAADASG